MIAIGQGLFGRVRFVDGEFPEYDRPYLVVCSDDDRVGILNVSSVTGKEARLR